MYFVPGRILNQEKGGSDVVVTRVPLHENDKVQWDSTSGKYVRKVET